MRPSVPDSAPNPSGALRAGGVRRLRVGLGRPCPLPAPLQGTHKTGDEGEGGEDRLAGLLREAGHIPLAFPLTRIDPPGDPRPLARGARGLLAGDYDVILLTSARALPPLVRALDEVSGKADWVRPEGVQVWVVGTATGKAAAAAGLAPDRVPDRFVAEGLLEAAPGWGTLEGIRILFPRAAEGRDVLPETLAGSGARVTLVEAYRAVEDLQAGIALLNAARGGDLDVVVVTAGSQAGVLGKALARSPGGWPSGVKVVVIGPATEAAARRAGLPDPLVAVPHTLVGVLEAVDALSRSGE